MSQKLFDARFYHSASVFQQHSTHFRHFRLYSAHSVFLRPVVCLEPRGEGGVEREGGERATRGWREGGERVARRWPRSERSGVGEKYLCRSFFLGRCPRTR
jgi:hypothetical protein